MATEGSPQFDDPVARVQARWGRFAGDYRAIAMATATGEPESQLGAVVEGGLTYKDPPGHLELLRRAGEGEVDIHVWRSRTYPGVLMSTVFVESGQPLASDEADKWRGPVSYEPYYDGIMSSDEARDHATSMEAALARVEMGME